MAIAALMVGDFLGGIEDELQRRGYFYRAVGFGVGRSGSGFWLVDGGCV